MTRQEMSETSVTLDGMPVDVELFNRTAPRWNCVAFPGEGMHYVPGNAGCLWCGMSNEQIQQEGGNRSGA